MSLSAPRTVFGIDTICFYNKSTGVFYGPPLRVVGGSELNISGEIMELNGGSSNFPWDTARGIVKAEMNITLREYPDYLFQLFMGSASPTSTTLTVGSVSTAANKYGTSIINGTNGISGVAITSADNADLKTGKYVIKATGAAAADVFISSTIDCPASLLTTDGMKIGAIDVSSTSAVLTDFGLTFTKVGTPAFVTGDTATFEVINNKAVNVTEVTVGNSAATYPEFGALVYAEKDGDAGIFEIDCFSVKASGMPIITKEKAFSEYSVTAKLNYDSARDGVYKLRMIK